METVSVVTSTVPKVEMYGEGIFCFSCEGESRGDICRPGHGHDVVLSKMPPEDFSFFAQSVSSVMTWRFVESPVFARFVFFVGRRTPTAHMSSCMMNTSRER